jgi:hypothetical protein
MVRVREGKHCERSKKKEEVVGREERKMEKCLKNQKHI